MHVNQGTFLCIRKLVGVRINTNTKRSKNIYLKKNPVHSDLNMIAFTSLRCRPQQTTEMWWFKAKPSKPSLNVTLFPVGKFLRLATEWALWWEQNQYCCLQNDYIVKEFKLLPLLVIRQQQTVLVPFELKGLFSNNHSSVLMVIIFTVPLTNVLYCMTDR